MMLTENETNYFKSLYEESKITLLEVDEEGVGFNENELNNFLTKDDTQKNLEKMMNLNRITKTIHGRLKFNYTIFMSNENNEINVKLKFFE